MNVCVFFEIILLKGEKEEMAAIDELLKKIKEFWHEMLLIQFLCINQGKKSHHRERRFKRIK